MFYCEQCRVTNEWPTSMVTSHGRCELCGKGASCWDRHISSLPETSTKAPPTPAQFYQCDVAEDETDSLWTSSVHYCDSIEEAEFLTMCELQADWGDEYMPDSFIELFGGADEIEFPGAEAWGIGRYWRAFKNEHNLTLGMLTVRPIEALAKLGKINPDVPDHIVASAMANEIQLRVVASIKKETRS